MSYPKLGTLGTTYCGHRMGEQLWVLIELASAHRQHEAVLHLEGLSRAHGRMARTNLALTGRDICDWDIDRLIHAEVA